MPVSNQKLDVSRDQDKRHKKILADFLKEEGNRFCADCDGRGPTWASVNLGVFLCLTCSGIHRSLGVHISQVRSTTLDTWLPKQVAFVKCMGNQKANKYWEKGLPVGFRKPSDTHDLSRFIRDKYVDKRYTAKDAPPPNIENYTSHPYVMMAHSSPPTNAGTPVSAPASMSVTPEPSTRQTQSRHTQGVQSGGGGGGGHRSNSSAGEIDFRRSQTPTQQHLSPRPVLQQRSSTPPAGSVHGLLSRTSAPPQQMTPPPPPPTVDLLSLEDPEPSPGTPHSALSHGNDWTSFQQAPLNTRASAATTQRTESPSDWTAFESALPKSPVSIKKDPFLDTAPPVLQTVPVAVSVAVSPKPAQTTRHTTEDILKLYDAPKQSNGGAMLPPNLGIPMGGQTSGMYYGMGGVSVGNNNNMGMQQSMQQQQMHGQYMGMANGVGMGHMYPQPVMPPQGYVQQGMQPMGNTGQFQAMAPSGGYSSLGGQHGGRN